MSVRHLLLTSVQHTLLSALIDCGQQPALLLYSSFYSRAHAAIYASQGVSGPGTAQRCWARCNAVYSLPHTINLLLDSCHVSYLATPAAAELLISLYEQERLDASLATAYRYAAELYGGVGKRWEAIKYARLSRELALLDKGFRDGDGEAMEKMSVHPERAWGWKKRVGAEQGGGCAAHGH